MFRKRPRFIKDSAKIKKKIPIKDYTVFLLGLSMQTADKLREKLLRKGYGKEEIENALAWLIELGYINDNSFAQSYFEGLKNYKHFGYYGMKRKMIEKKFGPKLIDQLLKTLSAKEELEIARKFLSGKKNKTAEQQMRMLQNRGFRMDVILKVVKIKEL